MKKLANFIVLEGEQGVLLVRPYTDDICAHWRFVDETTARDSSSKIYEIFLGFKTKQFHWYGHGEEILGSGFYEKRRYADHAGGRKYDKVLVKSDPKEKDWRTNEKSKSYMFKEVRDLAYL